MTTAFSRDQSTSNYRRLVSYVAVLVVLLTIFITWDSLFLVSRPNSSVIPNSFYGADLASGSESSASQEAEHISKFNRDEESKVEVAAEPARTPDSLESEVEEAAEPARTPDSLASEESEKAENVDHDEESEMEVSAEVTELVENRNASSESSDDSDCDLYHGHWYYDSEGPLYTNNTCPILSQPQNCQGNGRPDKEYENWRWKPSQCELPRFNATKFLELMSGKTITFIGDSVARNQMESLMCLLWQVEVPTRRGNRHMQRWLFKSSSVTVLRFWSAWLVHHNTEPFSYVPEGITKIHLDVPDDIFMHNALNSDVVVFSNGHWFPKRSVYLMNNEIVGSQLWELPKNQSQKITTTDAYQISTETTLTALATHSNYSGLTILTSYSPDHYENGAWNTGGSCTGKVGPLLPGQAVEHEYTNIMHDKQVTGFYQASKKLTNQSKLKLMDITEAFKYRHDGHPGPFRSLDPNKITKRGPNGRPPPQDCLHWCMPGPVDTWNEFMLELIRREFEGTQDSDT